MCHLVELLSCSLTEVHPSSFTELISQLTQLIPHNSHLTSHRTRLTPLHSSHNSHYSSHLTSHTQLNSLKSCFRVPFGGAVLQMTGVRGAVFCAQRNMNALVPSPPLPKTMFRVKILQASDERRSRCSAFVCRGT